MNLSIRPKYLAVAATAGLVVAAAAGGVGYAAASGGSNVSACVASNGRLAVQSTKGKCPKKTKKVSIAKSGPRGATGATGAAGKAGNTGAQGPGAAAVNQAFGVISPSAGTPVTVAGVTYTPSCVINSSDTTTVLTIRGASGDTVSVRGLRFDGDDNSTPSATTVTAASGSTSTSITTLANGGQSHTASYPGLLVTSGQRVQLLTLRMYANPSGTLFTQRCSVIATVTPAA